MNPRRYFALLGAGIDSINTFALLRTGMSNRYTSSIIEEPVEASDGTESNLEASGSCTERSGLDQSQIWFPITKRRLESGRDLELSDLRAEDPKRGEPNLELQCSDPRDLLRNRKQVNTLGDRGLEADPTGGTLSAFSVLQYARLRWGRLECLCL